VTDEELDEYDIFLQTWEPGERLIHASLPQNLYDPLIRKRLFSDSTGSAPVEHATFTPGQKVMESDERIIRSYAFFEANQPKWAAEFRDYVLSKGVPENKLNIYTTSFAQHWVDGRKRRQDSPEMLAIKASIRDHDDKCYPDLEDRYVINSVDSAVQPLLTPEEMAAIFQANYGLFFALLPDYIDHLGIEGPGALGDLYVRRGAYMPRIDDVRRELHYLSSYSLSLGPVEQFAQTYTPSTKGRGIPSIFSAPLPAIQDRVVAFAPFMDGMDLRQLELVVAPPTERSPLRDDGNYGAIREFSFR
jgi:hypothetical protein